MKKILFLILVSVIYSFGQQNRLVRQNELSDSLDAVRALIGTGGIALPDSVIFASELTPYATKIITDSLAEDIAAIPVVSITYPDANTIQITSGQAIALDPTTLEINGSNQLTIAGGVPLAQTAFGDSLGNYYFSGTDSIHYGATYIDITHGCGFTPLIKNIYVTPQSTTYGYPYYVTNVGATTFRIQRSTVGNEAIVREIIFSWQIRKP
jgi:hypothetical protein